MFCDGELDANMFQYLVALPLLIKCLQPRGELDTSDSGTYLSEKRIVSCAAAKTNLRSKFDGPHLAMLSYHADLRACILKRDT